MTRFGRLLRKSTAILVIVLFVSVGVAAARTSGPATPSVSSERAAARCLTVPPGLVKVLRASLSFSAGGQLFYARAVKSPQAAQLYFLSAQIRSAELRARRPIATWAVDKLVAEATASPLNATARAYSDLATPDQAAFKVSMRSLGALASQKCVSRLIR
jgi:hypothetical protein